MKLIVLIPSLLALVSACTSGNKIGKDESVAQTGPTETVGPHALIYKTKADYHRLVPVQLSGNKTEIIAYPHPSDLSLDGQLLLPTSLANGYLLDNKGINLNSAFLNMTYEQYAQLKNAPILDKQYSILKDKDPFTELWDCGLKSSFKNIVLSLNDLISRKQLATKCKRLK